MPVDHPRNHKRVLVQFLPDELAEIDAHLSRIRPGRENRSEFIRSATFQAIRQWKKNSKKSSEGD